jgi:hypothetical protein
LSNFNGKKKIIAFFDNHVNIFCIIINQILGVFIFRIFRKRDKSLILKR